MKSRFYAFTLLFLLPFAVLAQTVSLTPDNAYEGQTLAITAVTSSPLSNTGQASYLDFYFYQNNPGSGLQNYWGAQNPSLVNNNTMSGTCVTPGSATGWFNLVLSANNTYNFNSVFFINQNLQGPGTISGTINQGTPKTGSGIPYAGLRLFLVDESGDTVAITRTNANGRFEFLYLPYGTYYLHGEGADNSTPVEYVIGPTHFGLTGVIVTYDSATNRLVNVKEIDLVTENLLKLYPSVFNSSFALTYTLKQTSKVSIKVYDLKGALVATLVDKANAPAGSYNHVFNAAEANVHASGVYIVKVSIGEGTANLKIVKQ